MADIEVLPGKTWNAHAALHHALNVVKIDQPIIILWLEDDGQVKHSSAALRKDVLWMIEVERRRVLTDD
jgi:hypothetical protein